MGPVSWGVIFQTYMSEEVLILCNIHGCRRKKMRKVFAASTHIAYLRTQESRYSNQGISQTSYTHMSVGTNCLDGEAHEIETKLILLHVVENKFPKTVFC